MQRILLLAWLGLLAGCSNPYPSTSARSAPSGKAGAAPSALIGKWLERGDPDGSDDTANRTFEYAFEASGEYTYSALVITAQAGCTAKLFGYEEGDVSADSATLALAPSLAKLHAEDSCNARNTGDRPGKLDNRRFPWRIEQSQEGPPRLILTWPNGWEEVFVRES
jgi:hypothetical protein